MSSAWQLHRKALARREYEKLRLSNSTIINNYNSFDDWFLTYFLVEAIYSDMVQEELGNESDYSDTYTPEEPQEDTSSSYDSSSDSSDSYDSGSDSSDSSSDY